MRPSRVTLLSTSCVLRNEIERFRVLAAGRLNRSLWLRLWCQSGQSWTQSRCEMLPREHQAWQAASLPLRQHVTDESAAREITGCTNSPGST